MSSTIHCSFASGLSVISAAVTQFFPSRELSSTKPSTFSLSQYSRTKETCFSSANVNISQWTGCPASLAEDQRLAASVRFPSAAFSGENASVSALSAVTDTPSCMARLTSPSPVTLPAGKASAGKTPASSAPAPFFFGSSPSRKSPAAAKNRRVSKSSRKQPKRPGRRAALLFFLIFPTSPMCSPSAFKRRFRMYFPLFTVNTRFLPLRRSLCQRDA